MSGAPRYKRIFPLIQSPQESWGRAYSPAAFRRDAVAGVTLCAYMLPAAIGDASLARVPPETGLYSCIFAGLVYWALCSSTRTAVTVTSAISLLMGTTLGAMTGGVAGAAGAAGAGAADPARMVALASGTALLVAALAFLAWAIGAGSLVSFVSETVLIGFKAGVALTLLSTQLPKLFGMSSPHGGFWHCAHHFFTHLSETNPASLAVGAAALLILILGRVLMRRAPVALAVVLAAIALAGPLHLADRHVKLLGEVPAGFPPVGFPHVSAADINEILPLAMACFMLAAVETAAIGRMFATKSGKRLDANQELLALAGANFASSMGHGMAVSGGMSQSLVNESAGGQSPVSGLVSAALMLLVAVFFSDLLKTLPQPVLAAVVLMAVASLLKVSALKHLWRADRSEFAVAIVALAGVLASGLLRGVLIGAVISMILLIRRAAHPHVAFLGRIPGSRRFSDLERHTDNEPTPGVLVFRPEGSLIYFNADHVHDAVVARARTADPPLKGAVCDLSASPFVDMAGAEMLTALAEELKTMGIRLQVVEARSAVRDRLRREGVDAHAGAIDRFTTVADAVESFGSASTPG